MHRLGHAAGRWSCRAAFSLIELLVVLATIGVLAGLLLPAMARAKGKTLAAACSGNLRQLGIAFMMYLSENEDTFPTGGRVSAAGSQPEDWIWWQFQSGESAQPSMRDPKGSPIAIYLSVYDTRYFLCPADKDASARQALWRQNMSQELYTYSYSLNGHSERGMASHITADRSLVYRNKLGSVAKPSMKIMLAEEKGSPKDGPGSVSIDDGLWQPLGNPLSGRHAGKANVTFADGHVESVRREFADAHHPEHFDPAH